MKIKNIIIAFAIFLALAFNLALVSAETKLQVTSFSCTPTESVLTSAFSCTATVQNTGDASATLGTATLYPDATNWLENSNYPQSYGSSIAVGESVSVTFTGLKAIKSGSNGFSKIMLDVATDNFENIPGGVSPKVNIIDVAVTASNSASSAAKSSTVTTTTEVTAGGSIDVSLTFAVSSGGCSIGSQTNPKTISGMTDGSVQSRTWTITMGTTGNCVYTMSAAATGSGGVASKIDSTSSSITCTDCTSGGGSTSGGGGGGGGGGGSSSRIYILDELTSSQEVELANNDKVKFNISGEEHTLTLTNHTETQAMLTLESEPQSFTLSLGDEREIILEGENGVSIKLRSVNIITGKVTLVLSPIGPQFSPVGEEEKEKKGEKGVGETIGEFFTPLKNKKIFYYLIVFFILAAIISGVSYLFLRKKRKRKWGEAI